MLAKQNGVSVGAHPGYPDLMNFGRRVLPFTPDEIQRFCVAQIGSLIAMARLAGTHVSYVKPHGALANVAADDTAVAEAIARGIAAVGGIGVLATQAPRLSRPPPSAFRPIGDLRRPRLYRPGRLVPRSHPQAMLTDPDAAADRLIGFFRTGLMPTIDGPAIPLEAHSICIHGDSPHAVPMARRLREALCWRRHCSPQFHLRLGARVKFPRLRCVGDSSILVEFGDAIAPEINDRVMSLDRVRRRRRLLASWTLRLHTPPFSLLMIRCAQGRNLSLRYLRHMGPNRRRSGHVPPRDSRLL